MSRPPRTITVFTHANSEQAGSALQRVVELAREAGVTVRVPPEELARHSVSDGPGVELGADPTGETDLALVLGGDGTILSTLGRFADRDVPVFALNYGAIGFLATVEADDLDAGVRRALTGDFDVLDLPALIVRAGDGEELAMNDISFHRRRNGRVAEVGFSVAGETLGAVRCDGLVVSTPAGSTGYNLANAGPVLAWGVEGYVVSFIAPHTLTARALVVAPGDVLEVTNLSKDEAIDMTTDGRDAPGLDPGEHVPVRFEHGHALLAQAPGATFYHRLRDKFGRLAS
ncbi:MAG TPA: NAD(+)/NADH kinase [Thermoleophilaceae bacterium]